MLPIQPRSCEKILENPNMGWANDFSQPQIRLIGLAEVAGALGLVLPLSTGHPCRPSPGTPWLR